MYIVLPCIQPGNSLLTFSSSSAGLIQFPSLPWVGREFRKKNVFFYRNPRSQAMGTGNCFCATYFEHRMIEIHWIEYCLFCRLPRTTTKIQGGKVLSKKWRQVTTIAKCIITCAVSTQGMESLLSSEQRKVLPSVRATSLGSVRAKKQLLYLWEKVCLSPWSCCQHYFFRGISTPALTSIAFSFLSSARLPSIMCTWHGYCFVRFKK